MKFLSPQPVGFDDVFVLLGGLLPAHEVAMPRNNEVRLAVFTGPPGPILHDETKTGR
jgi:hypothetical protein